MTNRCAERAAEVVAEFQSIKDWESRYRRVIEAGKRLDPIPPAEKESDRFLVEGCISKAWLIPQRNGQDVLFHADSEASIVKGILGLLVRVYSHASPQEILTFKPDFLEQIGLFEHLSMNRRNGLSQVIRQIVLYATVFAAQNTDSDRLPEQENTSR